MLGRLISTFFRGLSAFSDGLTGIGRNFERWISRFGDWISSLSSRNRWLGGLFSRLFSPLSGLTDWLDRGEAGGGWLGRFVSRIFSPFMALTERLDRVNLPQREKVVDAEGEERAVQAALRKRQAEEERQAALSRTWVSRLGRIALLPFTGLTWFLRQYIGTRPITIILYGVPVIGIVGLLGTVAFQRLILNPSAVATRYEAALSEAIRAGDTEQAELFRIKLEQLGVRTDRGEYRTAMALAETGDLEAAYARMKLLAPETKPGFPGAHYWIAEQLLDGKLGVAAPASLQLAIQHLEHVRTRMGLQPEVAFLTGLAYSRLDQPEAAINQLLQVEDRVPAANVLLTELFQRSGQAEAARDQALALFRQLQRVETGGTELDEQQVRWKTYATGVIGDETMAQAAAEQWYRMNPNSQEAMVYRGTLQLLQVDRWLDAPNSETMPVAIEQMIAAAKTVNDANYGIVRRRAERIWQQHRLSPQIATYFQALQDEPELPGLLLEFFGTRAATVGDWVLAEQLLARASTVRPDWAQTWNNWAFVLNTSFTDRREEALQHANRAIELDGNNADYHETRGMIHYALGNFEAAVKDLEIATNGVNDLDSVHRTLADVHRRLGNDALAEVYEQQIRRPR